ncbi:MAG: M24 family peptidase [Planctomycetota bacterium]
MSNRLLALLPILLLAIPAAAQSMPAPDKAEFRARREALAHAIAAEHPDREVMVLLRGAPKRSDMGVFVQSQDFLYLTGVAEPDVAMWLMVGMSGALAHDELLVPPHSPFAAKWDGSFLAPGEESANRTGFAEVGNVRSMAKRLTERLAAGGGDAPLVVTATGAAAMIGSTPGKASQSAAEQQKDEFDGRESREERFVDWLRQQREGLEVEGIERYLTPLRAHKSVAELSLLRESAEIAAAGIAAAMRACEPGAYEFQLAAVARCVFSLHGCGPDAYAAIVGGGPNGCVLHYSACTRELLPTDLIVMDYAATLHGYCSDVTRTFPASGKFSPEQRKLVEDVHEIQQALLKMVRPGAKLSQIGRRCGELLREKGYRVDHGPCHHVGLAVHDPSVDLLEIGMVITVEPGAYLEKDGMGCRIEDTVLVTTDGCEILSKDVPSSPDAIEALMREAATIPLK